MPSTTTPLLLDTAPPARRPHLQAALLAAALLLAGAALGTALAGAWGWNLATAAPPANLRARLDGAALDGSAPALAPTLRLYRAALAAGFSVAFVTGRSGRPEVRNATVANLEDAGYGRACGEQTGAVFALAPRASRDAPPCYSALLMRPPNDGRPASVVKPTLRAALLAAATEAPVCCPPSHGALSLPAPPPSFQPPAPASGRSWRTRRPRRPPRRPGRRASGRPLSRR